MKTKEEKGPQEKPATEAPTELTKTEPTALAKPVIDFYQHAGEGLEGTDKSAFAIPFIVVLQGQSPQIETVDGAKPGMLLNSITNELMKEAMIVPCAYQRRFVRWAPRDQGGGYRGEYNPVEVELNQIEGLTINEDNQYVIEDDELKDTRNHYVLVADSNGVWQPAILSLTSTQVKKSKRLMSRIQSIELRTPEGKPYTPPSYSHIYKVSTQKEENAKGSWYGVEIDLVRPVDDPELFVKAKVFHDAVLKGAVTVSTPPPASETSGKF